MKKTHLGISFGESVDKLGKSPFGKPFKGRGRETSWELTRDPEHVNDATGSLSPWRFVFIISVCFVFFIVTLGRLVHLQLVEGSSMRERSDANRLQVKTVHAPRGIIYDKNGIPLVRNIPAFVKLEKDKAHVISYEEALLIEATSSAQKNALEVQAVRSYPEKDVLAHILGYTSEISKEELTHVNNTPQAYALGDRVGRAGLELSYEKYLKGIDGSVYIETNAINRTQREVNTVDPIEGKSLQLSLDLGLQKKSYEALKTELEKIHAQKGVVVAQDPKTGRILSLVSFPSYDNNVFSGNLRQDAYERLLNDANRPLFDRAISGEYPPGSLYKIITSAAGFLSGKLTSQTRIVDTGVMYLGAFSFPNWLWLSSGKTEGEMDVVKAIKRSNDIFFYQIGGLVGQEFLANTARKFNLGKQTGIDLPGESTGTVPDEAWKRKVRNEPWYPGDTYHMAIGQGDNLETPLQMNVVTAFVANSGSAYKPQLVFRVTDKNKKTLEEFPPKVLYDNLLKTQEIELIREGMRQACNPGSGTGEAGGTGWPFFDFGMTQYEKVGESTEAAAVKKRVYVGCKTGTAEFGDAQKRTHGWFTVFAPYDNPQIVLTVLIESGGEGSDVAAPVAKQILEYYFSQNSGTITQ